MPLLSKRASGSTLCLSLGALLLVAGFSPTARGATHRVCLDFALGQDLYDASRAGGSGDLCDSQTPCAPQELCVSGTCTGEKGETYGRDEGTRPYPAMRTLARVLDEPKFLDGDLTAVEWGWEMLDDNGCTPPFESDASTFRLQYYLWSENPTEPDPADRNFVLSYGCDGMPSLSSCTQGLQEVESIAPATTGNPLVTFVTRSFVNPELDAQQRAHYVYWPATFAESRLGQPAVLPVASREHTYVLTDLDNQFSPGSASNRAWGGHPTAWLAGNGWRYKHTTTHECGHLLAQFIPIRDLPLAALNYALSGAGHAVNSVEWQSAAAIEGFANFHAVLTWHDVVSESPPFYYLSPTAGTLVLTRWNAPVVTPMCQNLSCPAGTAVELDWLSALVQFVRHPVAPGLGHVIGMNAAVHQEACLGLQEGDCLFASPPCFWATHIEGAEACVGWAVDGETNDYWANFDAMMETYLTAPEYAAWTTIATNRYIDQ